MGTDAERDTGPSIETLRDRLGTDAVTSVGTLSDEVATLVEDHDCLRFEYVVGEVSDHGVSSNGHVHFDLVEDEATIHCVLFGYRRDGVTADLDDGQRVAVRGDLSYYRDRGQLSVLVTDAIVVGEGAYRQTYLERREALAADGLLDADAKQALPARPRCVGLVTSLTSDAREDAVTSLHDRDPDLDIVIQNATLQGDEALPSLMQAIDRLDADAAVEVIVVTRGGGADTQLRVFDEPALCRVLHRTDTPVVVGVGHETDETLAGAVADERVMTPTDVGTIVPEKATLTDEVATLETRLDTAYGTAVRRRCERLRTRLDRAYERRIDTLVTDLRHRLEGAFDQFERRQQRRRERARHRRQRRQLLLVLVVLGLLVLALSLYILLT